MVLRMMTTGSRRTKGRIILRIGGLKVRRWMGEVRRWERGRGREAGDEEEGQNAL